MQGARRGEPRRRAGQEVALDGNPATNEIAARKITRRTRRTAGPHEIASFDSESRTTNGADNWQGFAGRSPCLSDHHSGAFRNRKRDTTGAFRHTAAIGVFNSTRIIAEIRRDARRSIREREFGRRDNRQRRQNGKNQHPFGVPSAGAVDRRYRTCNLFIDRWRMTVEQAVIITQRRLWLYFPLRHPLPFTSSRPKRRRTHDPRHRAGS